MTPSRPPDDAAARRPAAAWLPALAVLLAAAGCGRDVETGYGRMRSASVNGTGVFADVLRARGHEVRSAVLLTDELKDWAEVVVRFAPTPGPPPGDEADWYDRWFREGDGRRLVYVPRDYEATREYWRRVLERLPGNAPARLRERVQERVDGSDSAPPAALSFPPPTPNPSAPRAVVSPEAWFAVKDGGRSAVCKALGGPWAEGVDPAVAALTRREPFKAGSATVLLSGDGEPLVVARSRPDGGALLAVAGGSFLLNVPLVEPARWPLALRVADWAGSDDDLEGDGEGAPAPGPTTRAKRVAFVEGASVLGAGAQPSVFALLDVSPFGRVAGQLLALGLAACLARAPRLGRPLPEPASGADRPVAHAEAIGALLARTGEAAEARAILDAYRHWRLGAPAPALKPPPAPVPPPPRPA